MIKQKRDSQGRFASSNQVKTNSNGKSKQRMSITNALWDDIVGRGILGNATSRSQLIKGMFDPRTDINDECGYPDTINPEEYRGMYDREGIATRVVEVLPKESWVVSPSVFETEDPTQTTEFEKAWDELAQNLHGDSWYQDEQGSPIWEYLLRADILSGIGAYGVVLLGLDDGKDMLEEVEPGKDRKLLYVRCFDESLATIARREEDINNPRFDQPTEYSISFNDPRDSLRGGRGFHVTTKKVHWTRCIHLADNLGSSEIIGVPRQQSVWNRLYDLKKIYGASGEGYWKGAFPGLSLETDPGLAGDHGVDVNPAIIRDLMEKYSTGLQRYLLLTGLTAKSLAPQVVDPSPQIESLIDAVCIRLGIPKRIFTGSERGELASSQDEKTWNNRLSHRQTTYITPRIIVPLVNRLISLGVLPEPIGYSVVWPDLNSLTEDQKATIAVKRTESMSKYIGGNVESMMVPMDFLTEIIGLSDEKAQQIVDTAIETFEDGQEDSGNELEQQEE